MIKKITFLNASLLICLMIMVQGCPAKTEYDVRFVNQNAKSFKNVIIGGNNVGTVSSGSTSEYTKVPDGKGTYSGIATDSSVTMSGSYTFTGIGKHRFSITLNSANQFSVAEDK